MSKRLGFLLITLVIIAAGAAILRTWMAVTPVEVAPPEMAATAPSETTATAAADMPADLAVDETTTAGLPTAASVNTAPSDLTGDMERHTSAVSLPELPPTLDLTGAKLGNQRIAAMDKIGDVYRVAWYDPSRTLFMAVVERDGMRSIWRLGRDGVPVRVMSFNRHSDDFSVAVDSQGVLYAQFENPGRLYRSADGGNTFEPVLTDTPMFWNIADDGHGTVYGGVHAINQAILYRSTDDGLTWHQWKDFQQLFPQYATTYAAGDSRYELRHLHSVYVAGNKIFVGTGDVARYTFMSDDDGATWKQVWDEGFTAAASDDYGTRLVFGPDTLRRHGLAVYDSVTGQLQETWKPAPYNYSGYTYSIVQKAGVFYAAFHTETNEVTTVSPKFGVIVSLDGYRWYPFLEFGPLTNQATTTLFLAAADDRLYLSVNGSLYAFRPLTADWFSSHSPFPQEKQP